MREAYLQATEDLRAFAEKVRELNRQKKVLRTYLSALREFKARVLSAARERGVDLCRLGEKDVTTLGAVFKDHAHGHEVGDREYGFCVPGRVPPVEVNSVELLDNEIARWEDRLNTIGDDVQLANVDLQNILQKQQQALQMLSNISKAQHDTVMTIIRKIGG